LFPSPIPLLLPGSIVLRQTLVDLLPCGVVLRPFLEQLREWTGRREQIMASLFNRKHPLSVPQLSLAKQADDCGRSAEANAGGQEETGGCLPRGAGRELKECGNWARAGRKLARVGRIHLRRFA